jgi:predicted transcriptional regulator YdeE
MHPKQWQQRARNRLQEIEANILQLAHKTQINTDKRGFSFLAGPPRRTRQENSLSYLRPSAFIGV